MLVQAAPGLQCPKETNPREYVTEDPQGTVVPDTAYYRRLVDDGSLLEVAAGEAAPSAQDKKKGGTP